MLAPPRPAPPAPPPARRPAIDVRTAPIRLVAFLAGAFGALGFAPTALFACAFFGVALLVVLIDRAPRRAAALGWWWGLGHFAVGVRWIAEAFQYQAKMPAALGWVAVAGLAALLATMPALTAWCAARAPARSRAWAFAVAWMAFEWVRGWLFTGFPWNPLAAAALPLPPFAATAALWGGLGVSGLIALAAAGLALADRWALAAALAIATVGAALSWGPAPPARADAPRLTIVQPNIGQGEKWDPNQQRRHLATLMRLSPRSAPGRRIVLWPEVALPEAELAADGRLRGTLATLLGPGDLLLIGGLLVERDRAGLAVAARNSLFAIDAAGRIVARYDKAHLVPGGEYVPLRPLADALGLSRLAPGALDFTPGPGARTLALPGLPAVGPRICYEMIFPAAAVERARRPDWIVNPSNDAWFGRVGPPQHLAMSRLRAIEEGLPIARSTPTGVSALIDGRGRVLASIPQAVAGRLDVALPPPLPAPPFARAGHFATLALALAIAALGWARHRRT